PITPHLSAADTTGDCRRSLPERTWPSCADLVPIAPQPRGSSAVRDEGGGIAVELAPAALFADDDVLDPDAEPARDDDRGLVREGHARLERRLLLGRDERPLVDVQADP